MYWQKDLECIDRDHLKKLQKDRFASTMANASRSPYYKRLFSENDIGGTLPLDLIADIPFTSKQDLRNHFPYGFLAVDLEETVRLHSSSGTTGNPTVVFHTSEDIEAWASLMARSIYMTGARNTDVFQNMMGYGLFTGGLGLHYGAEKLGMLVIPIGPGNSKRQLWFMQQFKTTVVHILPSYALRLHNVMEESGIDPRKDTCLRIAFIGAEPHTEAIRKKIEELLGVDAYNSYGLSEMCGPGVAFECVCKDGLHLWEDEFYMEVIDPVTGNVLPDGEEGELVLTTLKRKAQPLLRYRTRDLTRIIPGECKCGRTHRRIERIKGRSDDMLIINGVNLFPMQIEKVIMGIPEAGNNYIIEVHKKNYMDKITVKVEINENYFNGTLAELAHLEKKIEEELKAELLVTPVVKLVEASSLPIHEGKAKRVYDLREMEQGGG
ncbi:MAG: phenylacetate--CoA ligase [Spirochaetales bacterium]|nr:phenylacetate--CoA ligase [Spirochaetales bacterium]